MLITFKQLDEITATLGAPRCIEMADLINELCTSYGITDKFPFQMFLANVIQESGEFGARQENMNYRAKTLIKVWPKRFPSMQIAMQYEHNPQKLANLVYGGRMGNTEPNDGWQYRGGGFIGLTGKEIYTKYARFIKKEVFEASELIRTQDRFALDSSCWFFAVLKKLIPVANKGNFIDVVRGINGGTIGLPTRQHYYDLCKLVLK